MRVTFAQPGMTVAMSPQFAPNYLLKAELSISTGNPTLWCLPSADREVELSARLPSFLHRLRPIVSTVTAAALVFAQLPTARAASAMTRADYEACQARDEQGFRVAI